MVRMVSAGPASVSGYSFSFIVIYWPNYKCGALYGPMGVSLSNGGFTPDNRNQLMRVNKLLRIIQSMQ